MNRCLGNSIFIAGCALLATQVFAQSTPAAQVAPKAVAKPAAKPASKPTQFTTADAGPRASEQTRASTFTAAGSVIVLADGIVANATMAQIQPPADGFAYER